MYQVTCDDVVIYDLRLEDRIILSPKLDLEVKKNGTFSFIISNDNPCYDLIKQKKSIIKVYQIDKLENNFLQTELFRGTVYSIKKDFYKRKQVECEGELSFFNYTIVRPYSYQGNVENLFKQYVNNHNNQIDNFKKFIPRNCTVIDNNDYITRGNINYPTSKDEMEDKLIDILGGHFETGANEDGTRYIDYLQDYTRIASQNIQFGINLLDLTEVIKTDGVATRIIALGAKKENSDVRLTVQEVNGGLDYVQDDAAVELFGVIEKIVTFDNVTDANNLLKKAKQELQNTINATVSIDLNASDLHNLNINIQAFRIGDNVRVISIPHGLDRYFLISKLHLELDKSTSCNMTLGAVFKSFTQKQVESQKKVNKSLNLNENISIIVNELSNNVNNVTSKMDNFIIEVPSEYVSTVNFEKYKLEVNKKLGRVYKVKGSVLNYATLGNLQNNEIGDVYNIIDTGANYVYTEDGWDKLSENIDLSEYMTKSDAEKDYVLKNEFEKLIERVAKLEGGNE